MENAAANAFSDSGQVCGSRPKSWIRPYFGEDARQLLRDKQEVVEPNVSCSFAVKCFSTSLTYINKLRPNRVKMQRDTKQLTGNCWWKKKKIYIKKF